MLRRNIVTRLAPTRRAFVTVFAFFAIWHGPRLAHASDASGWLTLRRSAVAPPAVTDQLSLIAGLTIGGGQVADRFASRSAFGAVLRIPVTPGLTLQAGLTGYEATRARATVGKFAEPRVAAALRCGDHLILAAGLDGVLIDRSWPGRPLGWAGIRSGFGKIRGVATVEIADTTGRDRAHDRAAELRRRWQTGAALQWRPDGHWHAAVGWKGMFADGKTGPQLALAEVGRVVTPAPDRAMLVPWIRIEQPVAGDPIAETYVGAGVRVVIRLRRDGSRSAAPGPQVFDPFGS